MAMPALHPITSIEDLLALPDDGMRHELLDGEHVVTPAPSLVHQLVLRRLYDALQPAADRTGLCLLWSPADIHLGSRTLVQPDLFAIRPPDVWTGSSWKDVGVPLLVAEVLSVSTVLRDRGAKRRLYHESGVEEYWIVDIAARRIERWGARDRQPEIVRDELRWALSDGTAGTVDVVHLFDGLGAH